MLTPAQVKELQAKTARGCIPTMAKVIGDRTPRQYDKAEEMADAIYRSVKRALIEMELASDDD